MKWLIFAAMLTSCGTMQCQTLGIDVYPVAGKPKPAGRVAVTCDGKRVLEAEGAVQVGQ
jgi:predicted Rdx family selenoprotein